MAWVPIGPLPGGGGGGASTVDELTDITAVGSAVAKAVDAAAARSAIGAGTGNSNLAIGTTGSTAMAGNKTASDLGGVSKTGDETIAGIKTFSSLPVLPASDPTTANQPARKAYVDTAASSAASAAVSGISPASIGAATATQGAKADTAVQPAGLTKSAIGLSNVDNTSDANKPISTATQTALNAKANQTDLVARTPVEYLFWDGAAWPAKQGTGDLAWYVSAFDPAAPSPADMAVGDIWMRAAGA